MLYGPVAFRPRITPGLALEATRLSIFPKKNEPVAFRPMVTHGLAKL